MKLAALLNDRDKSRALAGKLAKLAEKRKQEKTRKQEEENMAEASTPTGAAVQEMRKSVLEARGRLREVRIDFCYHHTNACVDSVKRHSSRNCWTALT